MIKKNIFSTVLILDEKITPYTPVGGMYVFVPREKTPPPANYQTAPSTAHRSQCTVISIISHFNGCSNLEIL
jgi:hypothetical protein